MIIIINSWKTVGVFWEKQKQKYQGLLRKGCKRQDLQDAWQPGLVHVEVTARSYQGTRDSNIRTKALFSGWLYRYKMQVSGKKRGFLHQVLKWFQAGIWSERSPHIGTGEDYRPQSRTQPPKSTRVFSVLRTSQLQTLWQLGTNSRFTKAGTLGRMQRRFRQEEVPSQSAQSTQVCKYLFFFSLAPAWVSGWLSGELSWRTFQHWVAKDSLRQKDTEFLQQSLAYWSVGRWGRGMWGQWPATPCWA